MVIINVYYIILCWHNLDHQTVIEDRLDMFCIPMLLEMGHNKNKPSLTTNLCKFCIFAILAHILQGNDQK